MLFMLLFHVLIFFGNSGCTLVRDFCNPPHVPHHDVEVDVFAGLFSRKDGQILRLQLGRVVQYGPRIETSLRNGDIIFYSWWFTGRVTKLH